MLTDDEDKRLRFTVRGSADPYFGTYDGNIIRIEDVEGEPVCTLIAEDFTVDVLPGAIYAILCERADAFRRGKTAGIRETHDEISKVVGLFARAWQNATN